MSMSNGVLYAALAPPGHTPDFNQPYNATALIVCIGIFLPLAAITSAIRIYTRTRIISELAIDDCTSILSQTVVRVSTDRSRPYVVGVGE